MMAHRHLHKCFRDGRKRRQLGRTNEMGHTTAQHVAALLMLFIRGGRLWTLQQCIALHVGRVLQFSHATANSTRRQIRNGPTASSGEAVKRGGLSGRGSGRSRAGAGQGVWTVCYHCTNTAGSCSTKLCWLPREMESVHCI